MQDITTWDDFLEEDNAQSTDQSTDQSNEPLSFDDFIAQDNPIDPAAPTSLNNIDNAVDAFREDSHKGSKGYLASLIHDFDVDRGHVTLEETKEDGTKIYDFGDSQKRIVYPDGKMVNVVDRENTDVASNLGIFGGNTAVRTLGGVAQIFGQAVGVIKDLQDKAVVAGRDALGLEVTDKQRELAGVWDMAADNAITDFADDFKQTLVAEFQPTPEELAEFEEQAGGFTSLFENSVKSAHDPSFWHNTASDGVASLITLMVPSVATAKVAGGIVAGAGAVGKLGTWGRYGAKKAAEIGAYDLVNTGLEALMEGRGAFQAVEKHHLDKGADATDARVLAAKASADVFSDNVAFIGATNLIEGAVMTSGFSGIGGSIAKVVGQGLLESFQETGQFGIQKYEEAKHKGEAYIGENGWGEAIQGSSKEIAEAFEKGDKELAQSMLLGFALGGGMTGVQQISEARAAKPVRDSVRPSLINRAGEQYKRDANGEVDMDDRGNPIVDQMKMAQHRQYLTDQFNDAYALEQAKELEDQEAQDVIESGIVGRWVYDQKTAGASDEVIQQAFTDKFQLKGAEFDKSGLSNQYTEDQYKDRQALIMSRALETYAEVNNVAPKAADKTKQDIFMAALKEQTVLEQVKETEENIEASKNAETTLEKKKLKESEGKLTKLKELGTYYAGRVAEKLTPQRIKQERLRAKANEAVAKVQERLSVKEGNEEAVLNQAIADAAAGESEADAAILSQAIQETVVPTIESQKEAEQTQAHQQSLVERNEAAAEKAAVNEALTAQGAVSGAKVSFPQTDPEGRIIPSEVGGGEVQGAFVDYDNQGNPVFSATDTEGNTVPLNSNVTKKQLAEKIAAGEVVVEDTREVVEVVGGTNKGLARVVEDKGKFVMVEIPNKLDKEGNPLVVRKRKASIRKVTVEDGNVVDNYPSNGYDPSVQAQIELEQFGLEDELEQAEITEKGVLPEEIEDYKARDVASEAALLSRQFGINLVPTENGVEIEYKDLNNNTIQANKDTLDPNLFKEGKKLEARVLDNRDDQIVTIPGSRTKEKSTWGFLKNRLAAEGGRISANGQVYTYEDLVPIQLFDGDTETPMYIHSTDYINKDNVSEDILTEQLQKIRNHRSKIISGETAVTIRTRSNGRLMLNKDGAVTLSELNADFPLAVFLRSKLQGANGKDYIPEVNPAYTDKLKKSVVYGIAEVNKAAFPLLSQQLTPDMVDSIIEAVRIYEGNSFNEAHRDYLKDNGYDVTTETGLAKYIRLFTNETFTGKEDFSTYLLNLESDRNAFQIRPNGHFEFGRGRTKKTVITKGGIGPVTRTENLSKVEDRLRSVLQGMYFNVDVAKIGKGVTPVPGMSQGKSIDLNNGRSYNEFVKDYLSTNIIPINIGTESNPRHVITIQPRIELEIGEQVEAQQEEVVEEEVEEDGPIGFDDDFFQKTTSNQKASQGKIATENTIRELSARLADRIGVSVEIMNNVEAPWKGKVTGTLATINLAHATLDTPVHEILGHPVIRAIKKENSDLYENLLKELKTGKGREVLGQVNVDYNELTAEQREEEAIVQLLGELTADKLDEAKDKRLITLLRELLTKINNYVRNLLTAKEIEVATLPKNMTLDDLANLFAFSNSKLILPTHKVEYTTPDNQTFATFAEASNHMADNAFRASTNSLIEQEVIDGVDPFEGLPFSLDESKKYSWKKGEFEYFLEFSEKGGLWKFVKFPLAKIEPWQDIYKFGFVEDYIDEEEATKLAAPHYDKKLEKLDKAQIYSWKTSDSTYQLFHDIVDKTWTLLRGPLDDDTSSIYLDNISDKDAFKLALENISDLNNSNSFIRRNREYENAATAIVNWKKQHGINYDPEEAYSRGHGFYSVIGAYAKLDVELLFQNLISHLEDQKKVGGKFAVSAFTKDVESDGPTIDRGGSKIRFKIFPKSEDILWAASADVYSGSVWDAPKKTERSVKSEKLGVSYTKSPRPTALSFVKPNLVEVIAGQNHDHNELGIELTTNNFRLEYDDDVPFSTKKLLDNLNSILDQKYGKLVEPVITKNEDRTEIPDYFTLRKTAIKKENGKWYIDSNGNGEFKLASEDLVISYHESVTRIGLTGIGKQPTVVSNGEIEQTLKDEYNILKKEEKPVSQFVINKKVAAIKKLAKKYPRVLIRSEVRRKGLPAGSRLFVGPDTETFFQKNPTPKEDRNSIEARIEQSMYDNFIIKGVTAVRSDQVVSSIAGTVWARLSEKGSFTEQDRDVIVEEVLQEYKAIIEKEKDSKLSNGKDKYKQDFKDHFQAYLDGYDTLGLFVRDFVSKRLSTAGIPSEIINLSEGEAASETQNYGNGSFSVNTLNRSSKGLKTFLSFIPVTQNGQIAKNYLARGLKDLRDNFFDRYHPIDTIWNTLSSILASNNEEYNLPTWEYTKSRMNQYAEKHTWIKPIIEKLEKVDKGLRNEFVSLMNRQLNNSKLIVEDSKLVPATEKNGINTRQINHRIIQANGNDLASVIKAGWINNTRDTDLIDSVDGKDLLNADKVKELADEVAAWGGNYNGEKLKTWLEKLGIQLDTNTYKDLAAGKLWHGGENVGGSFKFTIGEFIIEDLQESVKRGDDMNEVQIFRSSIVNSLARLEARNNESETSPSFRAGNNTVNSFTQNIYAISRFLKLKYDSVFRGKLAGVVFAQDSYWLQLLSDPNNRFLQDFKYSRINLEAHRKKGDSASDLGLKDFSAAKHEKQKVATYFNQGTSRKGPDGITQLRKVGYFYPTQADREGQIVIDSVAINITEHRSPEGDVLQEDTYHDVANDKKGLLVDFYFDQVVRPEINRMLRHQTDINKPLAASYKPNLFFGIPELNKAALSPEDAAILWTGELLNTKVLEEWDNPNSAIRDLIKRVINNRIEYATQKTLNNWREFGIGITSKEEYIEKQVSKSEVRGQMETVYSMEGVDQRVLERFQNHIISEQFSSTGSKHIWDLVERALAKDYVVNYTIATSNMVQLMTGDLAQYHKEGKGENAIQRLKNTIKATLDNVVKRLAADGSPRFSGVWDKPTYRLAFLADREVMSESIVSLAKYLDGVDLTQEEVDALIGVDNNLADLPPSARKLMGVDTGTIKAKIPNAVQFIKINSTDAQQYATVEEHLRTKLAVGSISEEMFNNLLAEEKSDTPSEDFFKGLLQPEKLVYTGSMIEGDFDRKVFDKNSTFPLSRHLTADFPKLDALRTAMEGKNGVERASYESAVKMGIKNLVQLDGSPIVFDDTNTVTLDREHLGKQQDIPFKEQSEYRIKRVSQAAKSAFLNMLNVGGFQYNGKEYNGKDLRDKYYEKYHDLYRMHFEILKEEIGAVNLDLDQRLTDVPPIDLEKILKVIQREMKDRDYSINDQLGLELKRDDKGRAIGFKMPLWTLPSSAKIESLLASIVDNRVNKLMMSGKSFVLGSEEGFQTVISEDGSVPTQFDQRKMTFTSAWTGKLLPMRPSEDGKTMLPGQILVGWKYKGKIQEFLEKGPNGKATNFIDAKKLPQDLLTHMGFRIPNHGPGAMTMIEIAGFLPASYGDLLIASKDLVVQMGSDFDVDKIFNYFYHLLPQDGVMKKVKITDATINKEVLKDVLPVETLNELLGDKESITVKELIKEQGFGKAYVRTMELFQPVINSLSNEIAGIKDLLPSKDTVMSLPEAEQLLVKLELESLGEGKSKIRALKEVLSAFHSYEKKIQNDIIDMHFSIMRNPDPIVQRMIHQPLNYGRLGEIGAVIQSAREDQEGIQPSFLEPDFQREKYLSARAGDIGIGSFALDNVFLAIAQGLEITMPDSQSSIGGKTYTVDMDNPFTRDTQTYLRSKLGKDYLTQKLSKAIESKEVDVKRIQFKSDINNYYLQASMDNAKANLLHLSNTAPELFDWVRMLIHKGLDEVQIATLTGQPIMWEYVETVKNLKDQLTPDAEGTALRQMKATLYEQSNRDIQNDADREFIEKKSRNLPDFKELLDQIVLGSLQGKEIEYNDLQLAILQAFENDYIAGKAIRTVQTAINTDAGGVGKDFHAVKSKIDAVDLFVPQDLDIPQVSNTILNVHRLIGDYTIEEVGLDTRIKWKPKTINGFAHVYGAQTTADLFMNGNGALYPYQSKTVTNLWSKLKRYAPRKFSGLSTKKEQEQFSWFFNELKSFIYTHEDTRLYRGEGIEEMRTRLLSSDKENIPAEVGPDVEVVNRRSLARTVNDIKLGKLGGKELRANKFLRQAKANLDNTNYEVIQFNATREDGIDDRSIYAAAADLYVNPLPIKEGYDSRALFEDLVAAAYLQGGVQQATQYLKYLPIQYQKELMSEFLTSIDFNVLKSPIFGTILSSDHYEKSPFLRQLLQQNPDFVDSIEFTDQFIADRPKSLKGMVVFNPGKVMIEDVGTFPHFVTIRSSQEKSGFYLYEYVNNAYERIDTYAPDKSVKKYNANDTHIVGAIKATTPANVSSKQVLRQESQTIERELVNPIEVQRAAAINKENEAAINVMQRIVDNPTTQRFKEIAEAYRGVLERTGINIKIVRDNRIKAYGTATYTSSGKTEKKTPLSGIGVKHTIKYNSKKIGDNKHLGQRVTLHEMTHALTKHLVVAFERIQKGELPESVLTKEQMRLLKRLENVRQGLVASIKETEETNEHVLNAAKSLTEFTASAIDSKEVQDYLDVNKGFFERFKEILGKLIATLTGKSFSQQVIDDIVNLAKTDVAAAEQATDSTTSINETLNSKFIHYKNLWYKINTDKQSSITKVTLFNNGQEVKDTVLRNNVIRAYNDRGVSGKDGVDNFPASKNDIKFYNEKSNVHSLQSKSIKTVLASIAKKGSDPALKKLAQTYLKYDLPVDEIQIDPNYSAQGGVVRSRNFTSKGNRAKAEILRMRVNPNKIRQGNFQWVFMHEMTHLLTIPLIDKYEEGLSNELTKEQVRLIKKLDGLRLATMKSIEATTGRDVNKSQRAPANRHQILLDYTTLNLHEYVVGVMTSPDLQEHLKTNNLWDKVVNAIRQLIGTYSKETIVEKTMNDVLELIKHNQELQSNKTTSESTTGALETAKAPAAPNSGANRFSFITNRLEAELKRNSARIGAVEGNIASTQREIGITRKELETTTDVAATQQKLDDLLDTSKALINRKVELARKRVELDALIGEASAATKWEDILELAAIQQLELEAILLQPTHSVEDILYANNVITYWKEILDFSNPDHRLFDDIERTSTVLRDSFADFKLELENIEEQFDLVHKAFVTDLTNDLAGEELTQDQVFQKLVENENFAAALFTDLSRTEIPVIQILAKRMAQTYNQANVESREKGDQIEKVANDALQEMQRLKGIGRIRAYLTGTPAKLYDEFFMQVDDEGRKTGRLVHWYSPSFFKERNKARNEAVDYMNFAMSAKSKFSSAAKRDKAVKEKWTKYYKWLKDNTIHLDARLLFPDKKFTEGMFESSPSMKDYFADISGKNRADHEAELKRHLGESQFQRLLEAQEEDIRFFKEMYAARKEELATILPADVDTAEFDRYHNVEELSDGTFIALTLTQAEELKQWEVANSPYYAAEARAIKSGIRVPTADGKYVTITPNDRLVRSAPRRFYENGSLTGHWDSRMDTIANNPALLAFWETFTELNRELKQYLPTNEQKQIQVNTVLFVRKKLFENYATSSLRKLGIAPIGDALRRFLRHESNATTTEVGLNRDVLTNFVGSQEGQIQEEVRVRIRTWEQQILASGQEIDYSARREVKKEIEADVRDQLVRSDQDMDLGKIAKYWTSLMLSYKHRADEIDNIELIERAITKHFVEKKNSIATDSAGRVKQLFGSVVPKALIGQIQKMEYAIDVFQGKAKHAQGEATLNIPQGKVLTRREKILEKQLKDSLEANDDLLSSNTISPDQHERTKDSINKQIENLGGHISGGNTWDGLILWTQTLGLAWNVRSFFSNRAFGMLSNIRKAADGRSYSSEAYWKAFKLVNSRTPAALSRRLGYAGAIGAAFTGPLLLIPPAFLLGHVAGTLAEKVFTDHHDEVTKLLNLMKRFDVLKKSQDELYKSSQDSNGGTLVSDIQKSLYAPTETSEWLNQSEVFLAIMYSLEIKNKKGEMVNLMDAHTVEGDLDVDSFKETIADPVTGKSTTLEEVMLNVKLHVDQTITEIHGNYDQQKPLAGKQYVLGRAVSQFRTWLYESINTKYEKPKKDELLIDIRKGTDFQIRKGQYRSLKDLDPITGGGFVGIAASQGLATTLMATGLGAISAPAAIIGGAALGIGGAMIYNKTNDRPFLGDFEGTLFNLNQLRRKLTFQNTQFDDVMSEEDAANMRAVMTDMVAYLGLMSLSLAMTAMAQANDGGGDDEKARKRFAIYWINKIKNMQSEIEQLINPYKFTNNIGTLERVIASLGRVEGIASILTSFFEEDSKTGRYARTPLKDKTVQAVLKETPLAGQGVKIYNVGEDLQK